MPHPARIYDYWLGGKDNFAADRKAADEALALLPEFRDYATANRKFLVRTVRYLCEAGVRQFLDIGSGFPTSPNVHEIALAADSDARVVYVDHDPMVVSHAAALMAKDPNVMAVQADLRGPERVLREAGKLLDFGRPIALMFVACLHHIEDGDDPRGIVASYLTAVAPRSYLALSHQTDEFDPERMSRASSEARRVGVPFVPRSRTAILDMFNGRELIDPGLVLVPYWRPDGPTGPNADRAWAYGGVARL